MALISGPPPNPNARRRNARPQTVSLPAEGWKGDAPAWPLSGAPPALWGQLWRTPQAAVWARQGWVRTVARYARTLIRAEKADASAAVRQLEDRLGLTPMSMLRLRWEVKPDEVAEQRDATPKRPRLKAVDTDG